MTNKGWSPISLTTQAGHRAGAVAARDDRALAPQCQAGAHARSAVGLAELPFDIPVEIEGEVEIAT